MSFDWDEGKALRNVAKHRLAFSDAVVVFNDPEVSIVPTHREADGESRFKAIGWIGDRLFTVVFTERPGVRRLISARRANTKEEREYGNR